MGSLIKIDVNSVLADKQYWWRQIKESDVLKNYSENKFLRRQIMPR